MRWSGYPIEESTWEPPQHLPPDLVEQAQAIVENSKEVKDRFQGAVKISDAYRVLNEWNVNLRVEYTSTDENDAKVAEAAPPVPSPPVVDKASDPAEKKARIKTRETLTQISQDVTTGPTRSRYRIKVNEELFMVPFDESRTARELLEEVSKRVYKHWRFNKVSDERAQVGTKLNRLRHKESLLPLESTLRELGIVSDSRLFASFDPAEA